MYAYPINWWLVANRMKHGMLTVRREPQPTARSGEPTPVMAGEHAMSAMAQPDTAVNNQPGSEAKAAMTVFTFAVLAAALLIVVRFAM